MLLHDAQSSETHESLGMVQSSRSQHAQALDAFKKSLQLLPRRQHASDEDRVRLLASIADTHLNMEQVRLHLWLSCLHLWLSCFHLWM